MAVITKNINNDWDELKKIHLTDINTVFGRNNIVNDKYIEDTKNGNTELFLNQIKGLLKNNEYVFSCNSYPYILPDGVVHKLFWFNGDIDMRTAYNIFVKEYSDFKDVCIMCNNVSLKSILDINHYHVFIKY